MRPQPGRLPAITNAFTCTSEAIGREKSAELRRVENRHVEMGVSLGVKEKPKYYLPEQDTSCSTLFGSMVSGAGGQLETGMAPREGFLSKDNHTLARRDRGVYSLYTAGKYNEDMIGRQEDLVADQERNLERQREEGVERMGCARINARPQTD